jgi:hypothetical protein
MMKQTTKKISLDACTRRWADMQPVAGGRFCSHCDKCVVDFRDKTPEEIETISRSVNGRICGAFRPHQVKVVSSKVSRTSTWWKWAAGMALAMMSWMGKGEAQTVKPYPTEQQPVLTSDEEDQKQKPQMEQQHQEPLHRVQSARDSVLIHGKVRDAESGEPLIFAGVSLLAGGEVVVWGETDFEGYYRMNAPRSMLVRAEDGILSVSYVGYETIEHSLAAVSPQAGVVEVDLTAEPGVMLGEVVIVGGFGNLQPVEPSTLKTRVKGYLRKLNPFKKRN